MCRPSVGAGKTRMRKCKTSGFAGSEKRFFFLAPKGDGMSVSSPKNATAATSAPWLRVSPLAARVPCRGCVPTPLPHKAAAETLQIRALPNPRPPPRSRHLTCARQRKNPKLLCPESSGCRKSCKIRPEMGDFFWWARGIWGGGCSEGQREQEGTGRDRMGIAWRVLPSGTRWKITIPKRPPRSQMPLSILARLLGRAGAGISRCPPKPAGPLSILHPPSVPCRPLLLPRRPNGLRKHPETSPRGQGTAVTLR